MTEVEIIIWVPTFKYSNWVYSQRFPVVFLRPQTYIVERMYVYKDKPKKMWKNPKIR